MKGAASSGLEDFEDNPQESLLPSLPRRVVGDPGPAELEVESGEFPRFTLARMQSSQTDTKPEREET